jgi:hypothetical protein
MGKSMTQKGQTTNKQVRMASHMLADRAQDDSRIKEAV